MKKIERARFFVATLAASVLALPAYALPAGVNGGGVQTYARQDAVVAAASSGATAFAGERRAAAAVRIVAARMRENNRQRDYKIDAKYPQLAAASGGAIDAFNREVKAIVTREAEEFKAQAQPRDRRMAGMPGNTLDISYAVKHNAGDLVSVSIFSSVYYAGAAHGGRETIVYNYDLRSGQQLQLSDLFRPGANYLQLMSDYSMRSLRRQLGRDADTEMLKEGTAPKADNFKDCAITRRGIEINFEQYQVAAYAFGPQTVVIPYSQLRGILREDGPLAALASARTPARVRRR